MADRLQHPTHGLKAGNGMGSIPGKGWSVMKDNNEGIVWGGMEVKGNSNIFCTMTKFAWLPWWFQSSSTFARESLFPARGLRTRKRSHSQKKCDQVLRSCSNVIWRYFFVIWTLRFWRYSDIFSWPLPPFLTHHMTFDITPSGPPLFQFLKHSVFISPSLTN